jgi:hypothetical protein
MKISLTKEPIPPIVDEYEHDSRKPFIQFNLKIRKISNFVNIHENDYI